jgi:hypothetical protein
MQTSAQPLSHAQSAWAGSFLSPVSTKRMVTARSADERFVALLDAYRASGGLGRGDEVVSVLQGAGQGDLPTLARWISEGEVLCLSWQREIWLPLFQFGRRASASWAQLRQAIQELHAVYDAWELAEWFVQPHAVLNDETPVSKITTDGPAVLQAARAERFILRG